MPRGPLPLGGSWHPSPSPVPLGARAAPSPAPRTQFCHLHNCCPGAQLCWSSLEAGCAPSRAGWALPPASGNTTGPKDELPCPAELRWWLFSTLPVSPQCCLSWAVASSPARHRLESSLSTGPSASWTPRRSLSPSAVTLQPRGELSLEGAHAGVWDWTPRMLCLKAVEEPAPRVGLGLVSTQSWAVCFPPFCPSLLFLSHCQRPVAGREEQEKFRQEEIPIPWEMRPRDASLRAQSGAKRDPRARSVSRFPHGPIAGWWQPWYQGSDGGIPKGIGYGFPAQPRGRPCHHPTLQLCASPWSHPLTVPPGSGPHPGGRSAAFWRWWSSCRNPPAR